jgi:glycosyltransferase involved in cell wall biosynthesis
MGLLVGMGLQVGEVLPPQPDNPKGFFESVVIVNENRRMLGAMDRDWTCPPPALDRSAIDLKRLEDALNEVARDPAKPWGFKDPRTVFTLAAWLSALENARFLGVYRPAGAVAKSLETRDRFSQTAAESIAVAYNERLAELHQDLGFPIVRFGGDRDALLDHMKDLSRQLGLDWNPEFAKSFFEAELIHHARPEGLSPADEYLESVLDATVDLATWGGEDVISALERVESHGRFTPTSPYLGPQFLVRRTRLWSTLRRAGGEIGSVLELLPDDRRQFNPLDGPGPEQYQQQRLGKVQELESNRTYSHILATDALDLVPPEELDQFLVELLTMADNDGVVGLSGHVVDGPPRDLSEVLSAPRPDLDHTRYEHHRDDLEHAIRRAGWHIASWRADLNVVVLARSAMRSDPTVLTPSQMRTRLKSAERRLAEANTKLDQLRTKLAATQRDYTRLRSRRVVRFSLALARPFKPVFALARGGRAPSRPATPGIEETEREPTIDDAVVPYVHVRSAAVDSNASNDVAFQAGAQLGDGSPVVAAEPIHIGLFVPASQSTFPASTHIRVLRRFHHPSVVNHLSPVVLNAERYIAGDSPAKLDVAFVQRTGVSPELTDDFIQRMHDDGVPIVLDLDDDLIGMPAVHPDFDAFREWREPLKKLANSAGLITASTEALRQRLTEYNGNVATLLNALDSDLWFAPQPGRDRSAFRSGRDSLRLLYFGSRTHGDDLGLIEQSVRRPGNATTLTVVGGAPPGTLDWCEHVDPPKTSREYPRFVQWLRDFATDFDALVAPLADTPFNEAKSDLKFLEGTALGLPVICSDVIAFSLLRDRGVTVLCGPSPEEWENAISALREQTDLRNTLAQAATTYVRSERLLDQQSADLVKLLGDVVTRTQAAFS